uniref:Chromosome 9 open reading frame 117 n=1 Tax=Nothobranchius pienaari TaxID=704102 RepID=A0A1A8MSF9_9TELE
MFEQLEGLRLDQRNLASEEERRQTQELRKLLDQLHSQKVKLDTDLEAMNEELALLCQRESEQKCVEELDTPSAEGGPATGVTSPDEDLLQVFERSVEFLKATAAAKLEDLSKLDLIVKEEKELNYLLGKKEILQQETAALNDHIGDLNATQKDMEDEMKTLKQEMRFLDKELGTTNQVFRRLQTQRDEYSDKLQSAKNDSDALRQEFDKVSEVYHQRVAKRQRLQVELQEEMARRRQLEGLKQEAAVVLRQIITDPQIPSKAQWKMQKLVKVLGRGAEADDSCEDASDLVDPADPAPEHDDPQAGASSAPQN